MRNHVFPRNEALINDEFGVAKTPVVSMEVEAAMGVIAPRACCSMCVRLLCTRSERRWPCWPDALTGRAGCSPVGCRTARTRPCARLPNTAHARPPIATLLARAAAHASPPAAAAARTRRRAGPPDAEHAHSPVVVGPWDAARGRLPCSLAGCRGCSTGAAELPASLSCRGEHAAFFGEVEADRGPSVLVVRANRAVAATKATRRPHWTCAALHGEVEFGRARRWLCRKEKERIKKIITFITQETMHCVR